MTRKATDFDSHGYPTNTYLGSYGRLTDIARNVTSTASLTNTISSHHSGQSLTQATPSTGQNCDPGQEAEANASITIFPFLKLSELQQRENFQFLLVSSKFVVGIPRFMTQLSIHI